MNAGRTSSLLLPNVAEVDCGNGIRAALSHYPAQSTQSRHRHDSAQVSFLLAGSMCEAHGPRQYAMHGPGVGFKPATLWHTDWWGRAGALIFSLKLPPDSEEAAAATSGWSITGDLYWLPALVRLCFGAQAPVARNEILQDALAFTSEPRLRMGRNPPAWLEAAREHIHDAPDVIAVGFAARQAGVHRAHFCRMFIRFYGVPPSVYRRRVAAARAIAAMAASTSRLTEIAHASGFSDQAHLTRTLRRQTGLTPSALRDLLST
jgi:AraC-like DNA-binding protein